MFCALTWIKTMFFSLLCASELQDILPFNTDHCSYKYKPLVWRKITQSELSVNILVFFFDTIYLFSLGLVLIWTYFKNVLRIYYLHHRSLTLVVMTSKVHPWYNIFFILSCDIWKFIYKCVLKSNLIISCKVTFAIDAGFGWETVSNKTREFFFFWSVSAATTICTQDKVR